MSTKFEFFFKRLKIATESSTDKSLADWLNIKTSTLSMWKKRNKVDYELLFTKFEDMSINFDWLLTGRGPMLRDDIPQPPKATPTYDATLGIPLIPTEAFASESFDSVSINKYDISQYYKVPDFERVDFMIKVRGSSMYPKYNSGDIVACRNIVDIQFVQWHKVFVISTIAQGVMIKRLHKGSDDESFSAHSDNPKYPPFEIPRSEILQLAIVVGVIRLE